VNIASHNGMCKANINIYKRRAHSVKVLLLNIQSQIATGSVLVFVKWKH